MPNAVACWLPVSRSEPIHAGTEVIVPAGKSRSRLAGSDSRAIVAALEKSGIEHANAQLLEEKLEQGHILISVAAANEATASIAWHVFKHASAEAIVVGSELANRPAMPDEELAPVMWPTAVAA